MAAGTWQFPDGALTKLLDGTFDIDSDSWKVALLASSSNIGASTTTFAGVTGELSTANGYTAGGASATLVLAGSPNKTVAFSTNPAWTATGTLTARTAAVYEVGGNVLTYVPLELAGSPLVPVDVVTTSGFILTVHGDGTPPIFTLTKSP